MSLLEYITFSFLEYLSLFVFIFVQFRFSIKENITQIGMIALLLSFVSYSFTSSDLNGVLPLVQFIIVLLYIRMVMKVTIFNALLMYFVGYIVLGVAQTCIVAVARHIQFLQGDLKPATYEGDVLQFISSCILLLSSYVIYYLKGGFSFIEARSRFSKKTFVGKNVIYISFVILAFIITVVSSIIMIELENPPYLLIASILLIILISLFYLSLRKDEVID
ncbi:hypothetical protein [Cohnella panacarvi]|uniref:hypothetical protein n=1 Tax=Cohnella panacarvi TaxID=400776 RepID=UPI00047B7403|nr:hypothetical protein [Cohnella panacarvi]